MSSEQAFYTWHTMTLVTACADSTQAAQLATLWQTFFCVEPTVPPQRATTLSLRFAAAPITPLDLDLSIPLWSNGASKVWKTPQGICLQEGRSYIVIDIAHSHAEGRLDANFWTQPLAEQRDFFLRSLLVLLRQVGLYGLHANGLLHNEQGILLVGRSGSGKTTLTLSLAQAGWSYLGDDVVALQENAGQIEAHALQHSFACTPQTIEFFPALHSALPQTLDPVRQKRQVQLARCHAPQFARRCLPRVLLFPTIAHAPQSRLVPISETQAMLGLMEQSAGLLLGTPSAVHQSAVLKQLVQQTTAYQLLLGQDAYQDPPALAALLGALLA